MPSPVPITPLRPAAAPSTSLADVARLLGLGVGDAFGTDPMVSGVTIDSRQVVPGDLYVGLAGANVHGARFAQAAFEQGAVAVLTDPEGERLARVGGPVLVVPRPREVLGALAAQVYGRPSERLALVGVTGTNGKTTTAYLIDGALRALGRRTGLIGTVETRVGAHRFTSARTTPEAPEVHGLLAVMAEAGATDVVMEVSSHALVQHRVDAVRYDVAVFTNLSQDHLDYHGTMADYFEAKALLFAPDRCRHAVVCVDDDWGQAMARRAAASAVPTSTVGHGPGATWRIVVEDLAGQRFRLVGPPNEQGDPVLALHAALPGDFNITNTALAAVTLLELGHQPGAVEAALAGDPHVPGRMERVTAAEPGRPAPLVVVDYAHTPAAIEVALRALRPTTAGRIVLVVGAGGDRDRGKRQGMGAAAARGADVVVVTDDNPRTEDPALIREAVLDGARAVGSRTQLLDIPARGHAIAHAVAMADVADTVLIVGKGHETGQEIGGVVTPFDDRDAARAALAGLEYPPGDATGESGSTA